MPSWVSTARFTRVYRSLVDDHPHCICPPAAAAHGIHSNPIRGNPGVEPNATPDQIKTAYRKKSLLCHPDRVPAGPGSEQKRKIATQQFQSVADAYYTLSDTGA